MFTIRVNWNNKSLPEYTMYGTQKYSVRLSPATGTALIVMGDEDREVALDDHCVVFVMNQLGRTVDVIRVFKEKAEAA